MSGFSTLLEQPTRVLFFTGKGGMGKTTLACSTAVALVGRGRRVLIVSTDPASNLDEVLGTELGEQPRPVDGIPGLDAANIDPEAAAREYRERAVGPYRGVLPDAAVASMEESLSGACTVEIAAFDAFVGLLGDPRQLPATTTSSSTPLRRVTRCGCLRCRPPGPASSTRTLLACPALARWRAYRTSATSTPPAFARSAIQRSPLSFWSAAPS